MEIEIDLETGLKTIFDKKLNAHLATIDPPSNVPIRVFVHIDRFEHLNELNELFLYNFDADGNCIEFAFGEIMEDVEKKKFVSYLTTPSIHKPPFKIQITHQLDTVHLENFGFTISYTLAV